MTLTLDPAIEQRLQRHLASGAYAGPDELIAHLLDLADAESADDWLTANRDAIRASLDRSFAQAARGEGYSPEDSRALLAQHRAARRS